VRLEPNLDFDAPDRLFFRAAYVPGLRWKDEGVGFWPNDADHDPGRVRERPRTLVVRRT
jgi:hypothetical protein